MLKKIECYIVPSQLEGLRDALIEEGVEGMTVLQAKGFGRRSEMKKGKPAIEDRLKIEIVIGEEIVDKVVTRIRRTAAAGKIGGGKLFVIPVEDALRFSTAEAGKSAID